MVVGKARLRFGMRGFFVIVALLMVPCAVLGRRIQFFRCQAAIIEKFREDETVIVDTMPVPADWLTTWFLNGNTSQVYLISVTQGNADHVLRAVYDAGATELEVVELEPNEDSITVISSEGIEVLGRLPRLRTFACRQAAVSISTLQSFDKLRHLNDLTLWGDWLSDEHLEAIPAMPLLEVLSIDSSNITGAGISVLKRHKHLAIIELPEAFADDVSSEDLRMLRKALPDVLIRPVGESVGGAISNIPFADSPSIDCLTPP